MTATTDEMFLPRLLNCDVVKAELKKAKTINQFIHQKKITCNNIIMNFITELRHYFLQ